MNRALPSLTLLLSIALLPLGGQDPGYDRGPGPDNGSAGPEFENDPSRGAARISLLNGEVSVRRGDSGDVVAAALNAPVVTQDRVLTSSSSRAEIQFDSGNRMRIGSNSEVRLNAVEQRRFQVQVAIGTVAFRVSRNPQAEVEIDTPSISFRPLRRGTYRVTVREDGSSEITVREGEAEIFGPRGTQRVEAGVTVLARGSADDPEFQEVAPIGLDDWDRWNESRDRQLESSRSYEYVSPEISGAEDLEGYGRWANDPQYGNVWVPRVEAGWAPYRAGRWVWEDFYGWTWVSSDPWGWAPYHYGRWYSGSLGWAWYPGPRYSHHYWSPALVAFFGFGGRGGGIGFGFGNVGWVPLAPYERFHPWWGRGVYGGLAGNRGFGGGGFGGRGFVNNTTIINNTNITNIYRNARVNNGITAVGANDFGRHTGQFVGMNGASIRDAGLVRGVLPVTPDRASLRLADRQVRAGAFPQSRNVNFAGRAGNPAAMRVPFEQQQRGMEQVARQTFGSGSVRNGGGPASNNTFGGRGIAGSGIANGSSSGNLGGRRNAGSGSADGGSSGNFGGRGMAGSGTANDASRGANGPPQGWRRPGDPTAPQQGVQQQGAPSGFSRRGASSGQPDAGTGTHRWSHFGEPIHGSVSDGSMPDSGRQPSTSGGGYAPNVNRGMYNNQQYQQPSNPGPSSNGGAWHRMGDSSVDGGARRSAPRQDYSAPQSSRPRSYYDEGNNTNRFGSSPNRYSSAPQSVAPQTIYRPDSQPSRQYSSPRYDYGSRGGASQPVRISPPMVHERSRPSEASYGGGGGGGHARSAPSSGGGGGSHNNGNNNNSNNSGGGRRR